MFFNLHKDDDDDEELTSSVQSKTNISTFIKEKDIFVSLINQPSEENKNSIFTKQFWNENKTKMSLLFRLATILLYIPA